VINVLASFPGANPETMASAVVTPLERQFSRIAGVNELTSASSTGNASITLQFNLDRDINGAARDVQAAINAARSQLPANMPQNPSYRKVNPGDSASLVFALTSDILTPAQLYDQADSVLAQKISQVDGVGQVVVSGSARPAVRVEANPMLLARSGVGLESLRSAIESINVNRPKGLLSNEDVQYNVVANDQLFGAKLYAPLIVVTSKRPVGSNANLANRSVVSGAALLGATRLRDVSQVIDSVEDTNNFGSFNGKPAVLINVMKAPGANVIQMVDETLKLLPLLETSVPPTVEINVALNRTIAIRESINEVTRTLVISIILVVVVVFLFLREFRSTLIPSVSVPLSLFATSAVMYLLNYTFDNLSLMALTIATGFVVDDAIVVMENIARYLEDGMTPVDAAMRGSKEIGFTVVSMSLSLIAVFSPILLMGESLDGYSASSRSLFLSPSLFHCWYPSAPRQC
jgi:multidrug efflux pump